MKTTIELPENLLREMKTFALDENLTLNQFLKMAVTQSTPKSQRMVRPPIGGLGVRPIPARGNEELATFLEAEEVKKSQ